ncbi:MAG: hypothetical protein JWP72_2266 [Massilia sp.]|nr:hypothetical protein [Massilia sp.]
MAGRHPRGGVLLRERVDGIFIGSGDLAASIGYIGHVGYPDVVADIDGGIQRVPSPSPKENNMSNIGFIAHSARVRALEIMANFGTGGTVPQ